MKNIFCRLKNNYKKRALKEDPKNESIESKNTTRDIIKRDIKLVNGSTSDDLVDIVLKYGAYDPDQVRDVEELKSIIKDALSDYRFDCYLNIEYLPIIGQEKLNRYRQTLIFLKDAIQLHDKLTPQEVIAQVEYYYGGKWINKNVSELLDCIEPIGINISPSRDDHMRDSIMEDIAALLADRFNIDMDGPFYYDYHVGVSVKNTPLGLFNLFAMIVYENCDEIQEKKRLFLERPFVCAMEHYFYGPICYDIKDFRDYLPDVVDYAVLYEDDF